MGAPPARLLLVAPLPSIRSRQLLIWRWYSISGVLFISVNNSPAAIAHLITLTSSTALIYHSSFSESVLEALPLLPADSCKAIPQANPSVYGEAALAKPVQPWAWALDSDEEADLGAFIVHSSGSTVSISFFVVLLGADLTSGVPQGFPKPIVISHRKSVGNFSSNFGLTGFTTLPLYHNHGHSCLYRAFLSCKPIYLFPASTLPLTSSNIMRLLKSPVCSANEDPTMNVQAIFGVPFASVSFLRSAGRRTLLADASGPTGTSSSLSLTRASRCSSR